MIDFGVMKSYFQHIMNFCLFHCVYLVILSILNIELAWEIKDYCNAELQKCNTFVKELERELWVSIFINLSLVYSLSTESFLAL